MVKKLFIIAAMVVVGIFAFVGCGGNNAGNDYNAVVSAKRYEEAGDLLNGEFLSENRIEGNSSEKKTFVVNNEQEFENVFIVTPQEFGVDFESRMLIIYTCTAINVRQVSVKSVSYGSGSVNIKLQTKKPTQPVGDTCQPYQRYMFVTMDKLEVTTVAVEYD